MASLLTGVSFMKSARNASSTSRWYVAPAFLGRMASLYSNMYPDLCKRQFFLRLHPPFALDGSLWDNSLWDMQS
ncbi:hypothetical protein Tco_0330685 [Tanacetum coccineum]